MISDVDLFVTKYISVPKEFGHLNCAAFVAGIIRGALDGAGFSARCVSGAGTAPWAGRACPVAPRQLRAGPGGAGSVCVHARRGSGSGDRVSNVHGGGGAPTLGLTPGFPCSRRVTAHNVAVPGQAQAKTTFLIKFDPAVLQREGRLPAA